jgi:diguanylate cyclase (GGDEF)-like protein/PAS domain S-box-containing protein
MNQHHSATRGDNEGLWDWNLASDRIHFSPRWVSLVGCEDHEVGNTPEEWLLRVHPEDLDQVLSEIEAARAQGPEFDFRHRLRHKDGAYRWVSCRGEAVREGGQAVRLMGSHADVTADTVTDRQTGLPNRLLLLDRLTHSIERANKYQGFHFALLLLDLGRSATPAGPSGPATTDPLLTAAARRLETCLRIGETTPSLRHNDLVARVQGDQFAILLDGLKDVGHAKVVADRILGEALAPFSVSGREVFLSASVGVAVSATGYTKADDVLRDAETALHRARVLGGSHCEIFDTAILKSERAELQLEGDLKQALDRREFHLLYQPIVSLASNQIIGFEALVRWQHPVLGMIPPLDFIPIAERTGFIIPLSNWILREACLRLKAWHDSVPLSADLWVSVNLSGVQLKDPALVEQIAETLRDSALEARSLVLELTEGIAMENPTAVKTLLMQLRAMGVRISIDDFGTGYSSLAYLRQFPVDALKIDRSFTRGMETHKDTAEIIGTLTAMAKQLGLHVVAEGIENEEQVALLRSLNCESAQGFLFAKPLNVNKAAELLKTGLPSRPGNAGVKKPASSLRLAGRKLESLDFTRLSVTGRWLAVAAAAIVLLTSAGLFARFANEPQSDVQSASPLRLENAEAGTRVGTLVDPGAPIRTSDVFLESATPAAAANVNGLDDRRRGPLGPPAAIRKEAGSSVSRKEDPSAKSAVQHPAVVMSSDIAIPLSAAPSASVPETLRPAVQELTSLSVVHLHVVGSCQGRLVVSRDGVAFVPDETKDGFALRYNEFLHSLADGTLTIKSTTRTYRFKAAAGAGKEDDGAQLHDVVESIARFR